MTESWLTWITRGLLAALMAYVVTLDGKIHTLEIEQATALERFAGYMTTRGLIVSESVKDRAQLNERVAALEDGRLVLADVLARLRAIEELIRDRIPEQNIQQRR
jgi:hypothetical protein